MGGIVSGIGAAVGIGESLFGGGGGSSPPNVQVWQPQNVAGADTSYWNLAQKTGANNPYTANKNNYDNILAASLNNPTALGYQNAANTAGGVYTNTGNQAVTNSNALSADAMNLLSAGQSVWNTANDPQNALYKRTLQQLQDQINSSQAQRGITTSGYGADLSNEALGNFNIDWQNNQLARQAQGESSLANASAGANIAATGANNLGTAGGNNIVQGGEAPYAASTSILGNMGNALSTFGQQTGQNANNLDLSTMSSLLNYMGLGAQQSNAQGNFDIQNWLDQQAFQSQQAQNLQSQIGMGTGFASGLFSGFGSGSNQASGSNLMSSMGFSNSAPSSDAAWLALLSAA